jgi:hypothetical protein
LRRGRAKEASIRLNPCFEREDAGLGSAAEEPGQAVDFEDLLTCYEAIEEAMSELMEETKARLGAMPVD